MATRPHSVWRRTCDWNELCCGRAAIQGGAGTGYASLTAQERAAVDRLSSSPEDQPARRQLLQMLQDDAKDVQSRDAAANLTAARRKKLKSRILRICARYAGAPAKRPRHARHIARVAFTALRSAPSWTRRSCMTGSNPGPLSSDRSHAASVRAVEPPAERGRGERLESLRSTAWPPTCRNASQPHDYLLPPANATPITTAEQREAQIERADIAFEQRGCLACHNMRNSDVSNTRC